MLPGISLNWYPPHIVHASILSLLAKQEKQLVAANNMKQSEVMKVDVGGRNFHVSHVSRSVLPAQPYCLWTHCSVAAYTLTRKPTVQYSLTG